MKNRQPTVEFQPDAAPAGSGRRRSARSAIRPAALLRALAALAAAATVAAVLTGSARAQDATPADDTETTLVSNGEQSIRSGGTNLLRLDAAQDITTGTNAAGYKLSSIDLWFWTHGENVTTPSVSLVSGSAHATDGVSLTGPASLVASTTRSYTFTAPANTTMSASTQYWIVIEGVPGTTGGDIFLVGTDSTSEDAAAEGWSIGDYTWSRDVSSDGAFTWGGQIDDSDPAGQATLYPPGANLLSVEGVAVGGV